MIWYPTQSHYPDHEQISPSPTLIMSHTFLRSDKYTFLFHLIASTSVPILSTNTNKVDGGLNSFGCPIRCHTCIHIYSLPPQSFVQICWSCDLGVLRVTASVLPDVPTESGTRLLEGMGMLSLSSLCILLACRKKSPKLKKWWCFISYNQHKD